jgi:hypothetical protein
MSEESPLVEGEYGEGAYGPTIMLIAPNVDGIRYLRSIFDSLASSAEGFTIRLGEEREVVLNAALWALTLRVVADVRSCHLTRDRDGGFEWVGTPSEWHTLSQLIAPLLQQRGHQYLTSEVDDDALIEISRDEQFGPRGGHRRPGDVE